MQREPRWTNVAFEIDWNWFDFWTRHDSARVSLWNESVGFDPKSTPFKQNPSLHNSCSLPCVPWIHFAKGRRTWVEAPSRKAVTPWSREHLVGTKNQAKQFGHQVLVISSLLDLLSQLALTRCWQTMSFWVDSWVTFDPPVSLCSHLKWVCYWLSCTRLHRFQGQDANARIVVVANAFARSRNLSLVVPWNYCNYNRILQTYVIVRGPNDPKTIPATWTWRAYSPDINLRQSQLNRQEANKYSDSVFLGFTVQELGTWENYTGKTPQTVFRRLQWWM